MWYTLIHMVNDVRRMISLFNKKGISMDNGQLLLILLVSFAIMVMIKIPIARFRTFLHDRYYKMGLPLTSAINSMYSSVNNFHFWQFHCFMLWRS